MDDARPAKPPVPHRPSKKRAVRAAFVVTVSMAASGAAGCYSTSNPPPPGECPGAQPISGEPCTAGSDCSFSDECGNEVIATCVDDFWQVEWTGTCNPPPPECPAALPLEGEPCDEPAECFYTDACGNDINASCDGFEFTVSEPIESCNPPPPCPLELPDEGSACELTPGGVPEGCSYEVETPCGVVTASAECVSPDGGTTYVFDVTAPACTPPEPDCAAYTNAGLCGADTTCRWLVPGCGEGPEIAFAAGCYPIADCALDGCAAGETCAPVVYNPCFNSECAACGAEADVCLPSEVNG